MPAVRESLSTDSRVAGLEPPPLMGGAEAPIGIFDSGLGGLSIVSEVRSLMPAEDLIYFADSAYCPYGTRSPAEITSRCRIIAAELIERDAKLLIVACNTACAVALTDLRARFSIPIVGLEPAVKPATKLTRSQRVAVLATPRTIASERLSNLIRNVADSVEVKKVAAPGLVEIVETGDVDGPHAERMLRDLIEPLLAWGVDVIVLGCTHYPFLRRPIERLVGSEVHIVDSGEAIARRVRAVLTERDQVRSGDDSAGSFSILTSGDPGQVETAAGRLLGWTISATGLDI
jgi:glutamate racemase